MPNTEITLTVLDEHKLQTYLSVLNQQFVNQLTRNEINKGYSLFFPQSNPLETFNEMNAFLTEQLKKNNHYLFFCQKITFCINLENDKDAEQAIDALCNLMPLLDKTKLNQLNLSLTSISQPQIDSLSTTLQTIEHTTIRFDGLITTEQALFLEAINDTKLQLTVPYHQENDTKTTVKHDLSRQPTPVTLAKIQALMDKEIELQPLQSKIGFQNQHHYQQQVQQKTDIKIMQSWQIEQAKESNQQSENGYSRYCGDERNTLISWQTIEAALNPDHFNHQASCLKLGEEIIQYHYKGRNLIDLWQRITGDVTLTQQNVIPNENDQSALTIQFYSPFIPKQISHKTLLTIVRYPHLFQDGVQLASLPDSFCFSRLEGALFTNPSHVNENASPFTQRINSISQASLPSAEHFHRLRNSDIPSHVFFDQLTQVISPYHAWHYWRRAFTALNSFNQQGIKALNEKIEPCLYEMKSDKSDYLNYFIQALNYYHYQKISQQQTIVCANLIQFEYQEQTDYQQGVINSLSMDLMNHLPQPSRESIHNTLIALINCHDFINDDTVSLDTKTAYRQLLLSTINYHQDKLPEPTKRTPLIEEVALFQLLDIIGEQNSIKIVELALCQNISVIYNVLTKLQAIYQLWGEIGLRDFSLAFITPAINLLPLANSQNQQAIEQLLQLSNEQYHWWQQLTIQHATQSGFAECSTSMAAFQHFLSELDTLEINDPLTKPCPLQGLVNLPVGLDRVISLLKYVKKPSEQWRNLMQLDWRASGVIYAAQTIKYQFVNADMQLNLAYESAFSTFIHTQYHSHSYHKFDHYHANPFDDIRYQLNEWQDAKINQQLFDFSLSAFYRYIGSQKYTAPMIVYQQLVETLTLPEQYTLIKEVLAIVYISHKLQKDITYLHNCHALILSQILPIMAYTTTGPRALDRLPATQQQRAQQLNAFIHAVYECARETCFDKEMSQFLNDINAVAFEKLLSILHTCTRFFPKRYHSEEKVTKENRIRLDLAELTQILQIIKHSQNHFFQLALTDDTLFSQITKHEESDSASLFKDVWKQLFTTQNLVETYNHYFIDALNRMTRYNQKSHYACFLMACIILEKNTFSFENKGRLIRLLGLIPLTIENFSLHIIQLQELLKQLNHYQEARGTEALDKLLSTLSSIIPLTNNALDITKIQAFITCYLNRSMNETNVDIAMFTQCYFIDCRIDNDLNEIRDRDFYESPHELDQAFSGLGSFFTPIKAILLHHYPVSFGENKQQAWQTFLSILQKTGSSEQQQQLLQTLIPTTPLNIDLNTLNQWLNVLSKPSNHSTPFHPEYFKSLSLTLIMHKEKQAFLNTLNKWLDFPGTWLSVPNHIGFIRVLNEIAALDQGHLCLEKFYQAASTIAQLSSHTLSLWYDNFIKFINTSQHHGMTIESLNLIFITFYKLCNIAREKKYDSSLFKHKVLQWLSNIEQTVELTLEISQAWDDINPMQSFHIMLILVQITELDLKEVYQSLRKMSLDKLIQIASCYQLKPIPAPRLFKTFIEGHITLEAFLAQHTRDPHFERDKTRLGQQFDNEILWPYFDRTKYTSQHLSSLLDFNQQLYAQLKFINYLGYEGFRHLSLNEIRQRLHNCRKALIEPVDDEERMTIHLTALSLIREAVYKTSQAPAILWPSAVQLLGILSALNHQSCSSPSSDEKPLYIQMATGEGKSLLAVFMAILVWLKGSAVTVVTHRASLALRDANAYAPLFESLGIACTHLIADNYRQDFYWHQWFETNQQKSAFDGIYYAEFNDLALIRQQRLLNIGQDIDNMSFIIDEGDEIILHNQADNNLTQTIGSDDTHPDSWVFEALTEYLDTLDTKQNAFSVRVADLVNYLHTNHPTATKYCQKTDFLIKLPLYLQAVWQSASLKAQIDFVIKPKNQESDEYYAAVLLNDKPMPPNVTFNGLIQQALHGRLNHHAKKQRSSHSFPIAPESTLFSTMSPEAVLQWMKQSGQVIALSATIGANAERMEMQQNYGFNYLKLPKMQSNLRVDYPVRFCLNQQLQLRAIAEICTHYSNNRTNDKSRAILIVVDNILLSEKLNEFLRAYSSEFSPCVLHADLEDISDSKLSELEFKSGFSGHILIAVGGLISRGFDIKLSSAKQIVVISTYLKNGVDEVQVKGRASRINQSTGLRDKGKYYAVYDLEREQNRYPCLENKTADIDLNPEAFKQRQYFAHYQQESAFRLHRQLVGISKNTLQNHFFIVWKTLFKNEQISKATRDEIMTLFTNALEKITLTLPINDFSIMSHQANEARLDYNHTLLTIYETVISGIKSAVGNAFFKEENIIRCLQEEMEVQQHHLIDNHHKTLATGANEPEITIYKQWKEGVKFNAYLTSGKQNLGNYMRGVINMWWLSKDNKTNIQLGKKALAQKIHHNHFKKSDFLSQLKPMIENINTHEDLLENFLIIYYQKLSLPDETRVITIPLNNNNNTQLNEYHVTMLTKKYPNQQAITFIHDPLVGRVCQISLTGHHLKLFEQLQQATNDAYKICQIISPLDFRIKILEGQTPCLYQVMLDFSGHQFDAANRQQVLTTIASNFDMDIQPLFEAPYLPSMSAMRTVLLALNEKAQEIPLVSSELLEHFQNIQQSLPRHKYYENVFKPTINLLSPHFNKLTMDLQMAINALLHYKDEWCYQDQSGKPCKRYPPGFNNLTALLENDKKRQSLDSINHLMKKFRHNPFKESLLFRQQEECIMQLTLSIIQSRSDETLQSIYEKWQRKSIQYLQQEMTVYELIQLRKQQSNFLNTSKSPDLLTLCQQVERIIDATQQIIAKSVAY